MSELTRTRPADESAGLEETDNDHLYKKQRTELSELENPTDQKVEEAKIAARQRITGMMQAALKGVGEVAQEKNITSTEFATPKPSTASARLYIGSLHYDLTEQHVRKIFEPFGAIKSVEMSHEPNTGRSKGFCFLEYMEPESAIMALGTMQGVELMGRPIKVGRPTQANHQGGGAGPPRAGGGMNFPALAQMQLLQRSLGLNPAAMGQHYGGGMGGVGGVGGGMGPGTPGARVYVGSVPFEVPQEIVQQLFSPFGRIRSCQMLNDPNNPHRLHRGYGFIEFDDANSANQAVQAMNGFVLLNRSMKVGYANRVSGSDGAVQMPGMAGAGMAMYAGPGGGA